MNRVDVSESIASLSNYQNLNQSMERKIGEEMILEKINKIFDEVAKDRDDFESSYVELSNKPKQVSKKPFVIE